MAQNTVITFEPIKIWTCLAPQNDHLNLNFVKDIYVVGETIARNCRKMAICNSLFLCIRRYMWILSVSKLAYASLP